MLIRRHAASALIAPALALLCLPAAMAQPPLRISGPRVARVFDLCEFEIRFEGMLSALNDLPGTQVHDAYDADRDGRYVRLNAHFTHESGLTLTVPAFALRERPNGPWRWRLRWAPLRAGPWRTRVTLNGRASKDSRRSQFTEELPRSIIVREGRVTHGPLVMPGKGENPRYLRRLRPDGSSEALWLFGACRAWVVRNGAPNPSGRKPATTSEWAGHEWIDREKELLAPMREAGYNLLNQWMAPWEYLLIHHDRAEHWRNEDDTWRRVPPLRDADWTPYQCYDQGRAAAFDRWVRQCEGGPGRPTVHMLLSPLPHQCLQVSAHPWGLQESGWSPADDAGKQGLERLNGFSGFRPRMKVWEFFQADPSKPLDDRRSEIFDHQANFWRYLIARWGYSRALGAWVLIDELDGVGDEVGVMARKTGWWAHPECGRWLADTVRLFRGQLTRSDGLKYLGDPYRHPVHAATTSWGGEAKRGGNLDWTGGPKGARPDLMGWHWYPWWPWRLTYSGVWAYTLQGVLSFSRAPLGDVPRLISEFGMQDRYWADDRPSQLYPSMVHFGIWSAIFSGQAGTPMDWDDGKEFGELRWRSRKGPFDRAHYPIDNAARMKALRTFLAKLSPEDLAPCGARGARVTCEPEDKDAMVVLALYSTRKPDALYGYVFAPEGGGKFTVKGLAPGRYELTWFDPWTGRAIRKHATHTTVGEEGPVQLDAGPALGFLRKEAGAFPAESRLDRGKDVAFKLLRVQP